MRTRRCAYRGVGGRCRRVGFGDPPLCSIHAVAPKLASDIAGASGIPEEIIDAGLEQLGQVAWDIVNGYLSRNMQAQARVGEPEMGPPPPRRRRVRAEPPPPRRPPPPPPEPEPIREDPRDVLGFDRGSRPSIAQIKERRNALARILHSDVGGSNRAMQRLNEAADALMNEIGR